MNIDWSAVISGGFGVTVVGGVVTIIKAWWRRPIIQANAATELTGEAREWMQDARAQIKEARDEAREARREADDARREANEARRAAEEILHNFRKLEAAIMSPFATIESLRQMIGDPGTNGAARVPKDVH